MTLTETRQLWAKIIGNLLGSAITFALSYWLLRWSGLDSPTATAVAWISVVITDGARRAAEGGRR